MLRVRIGEIEGDVADAMPLSVDSGNLEWYFDINTRNLDYIVANNKDEETEVGRRRKRSSSTNLAIVDDLIDNVVVSPSIYR